MTSPRSIKRTVRTGQDIAPVTTTSADVDARAGAKAATTQADQAYQLLRADILSCRLQPGAKVKINEVTEALGVSLGSIREALSRLGAEGWVIAEPQKGYRVAPISKEDLLNLTQARIEIETLCLRDAMKNGGIEWESRILAAFHALRHLPERNVDDAARLDDDWALAHSVFHEAILSACENPWLLRMRKMLFAQSERYRRLSVPLRHEERDVDQEHHEIVKAILAHDAERASAMLAHHFEKTTGIVVDSLSDNIAIS